MHENINSLENLTLHEECHETSVQIPTKLIIKLCSEPKLNRFRHLLEQTDLPARIADIYKEYMASVWQLDCQGERKYSSSDERFETESQDIHTLMLACLEDALFLSAEHLFVKCSKLIKTGKPFSKLQSRELAKVFSEASDDAFFIASSSGGSRKKHKTFQTSQDCVEYFKKVRDLHPLWNYIIDFFEKNDYASCDKLIKKDKQFIKLAAKCRNVPESLIKRIYERQDSESKKELQPLGLALEHARRELGIGEAGYDTLRKGYKEGKKLQESTENLND